MQVFEFSFQRPPVFINIGRRTRDGLKVCQKLRDQETDGRAGLGDGGGALNRWLDAFLYFAEVFLAAFCASYRVT
jgi:hypothetical protein